jgi:hypothetical protein
MISMGETESRADSKRTDPHVYYVRNEPVMQAALDVFTLINKHTGSSGNCQHHSGKNAESELHNQTHTA